MPYSDGSTAYQDFRSRSDVSGAKLLRETFARQCEEIGSWSFDLPHRTSFDVDSVPESLSMSCKLSADIVRNQIPETFALAMSEGFANLPNLSGIFESACRLSGHLAYTGMIGSDDISTDCERLTTKL